MKQDGTLECLGRLSDGQVKLRGQRIELGEIEHAALRTPGCHGANAAVIGSNLILFCAVDSETHEADVKDSCNSWLPRYMAPNEIVLIGELPRLPSGKIDSKTLREEFIQTRANAELESTVHQETADPKAAKIVQIVSDILKTGVSERSVLTAAGMDSLSAIQLAATLRDNGLEISVAKLLKCRLLQDICTDVQEISRIDCASEGANGVPERCESVTVPTPEELGNIDLQRPIQYTTFCTPLQSAMLAETARNPALYCNEILLRAMRDVSVQALIEAFNKVIQSNEALRTGFVYHQGQHVSVVFSTPSDGQVSVLTQSKPGFQLDTADDFLHPFMVQLIPNVAKRQVDILIQAHHAIYDGWSMDMLLSDVSQLLNRQLLPRRHQFKQVLSYLSRDANTTKDEARAFWSEMLLGWNKPPFPKLLSRPEADKIKTHCAFLNMCPSSVRELSQSCEISTQVLFQAALALVWQGITGQPDVLVGSVLSGRTIPVSGIEGIIGPCIVSMPLRVDLESMRANIDLLKSIHAKNRSMMEHCDLPLHEIGVLAGLRPGESMYDVLFVYQQSLYSLQGKCEVLQHIEHIDRLETNLLVEVEPTTTGFSLQITYHSSFVSEKFVDQMSQQIRSLSQKILNEPSAALGSTAGLGDCGLSIYSAKTDPDKEPDDVASLFDEAAKRNPHAEALRIVSSVEGDLFQVATMTYASLSRSANKTAHFVQGNGAEVGEIVAIIMNKSTALYTAILGVIKAGCAYLPILPATPVSRVREILRQSQVRYCLVDDAVNNFQDLQDMVIILNANEAISSELPDDAPIVPPDADRLSYVIFTSGTTGVPKGVAVTQRNLASNITHLITIYPKVSVRPRLLQACSHAFDVSAFEIFYAWYAGMSLCAADNDILFRDIEHAIRALEITHLSLTPTVAALIDPKNVPGVKFLVTAGEPVTSSVVQKWGSLLFQGYGPSETTNICSVKKMSHGEFTEHLGWVFPGTSVVVLSPNTLDVVPFGWLGEFCFGGSQVARGYLNDDELTTQKFIEHPSFGRIYRSGDVGRMLPNGSLMIIGRLDSQLKVRGQRVEASEIDGILTSTTQVHAAVTMLTQSIWNQSEQLTTFYTPVRLDELEQVTQVTLDTHQILMGELKARLPSYMVPTYLIPIPQIPRTSSGKVDGPALKQYFSELQKEYLETVSQGSPKPEENGEWTEQENLVAEAISESYNILQSDIGRWTPFPALGIDSISAISFSKLSFWIDQFRGFEGSPSFARSTRLCLNQCMHSVSIGISLEDIQKKSRSFGVSLLSLCQASWAAVLSSVFERSDIVFGNVVSGRTIAMEGIDRLIAPCFNTIPLRMDISRCAQNMDLMKAFQHLNSRLLPYQFSPLKLIQKIAGTRHRGLFDTLFLLQQPLRDMDTSVWTLEEDIGDMDVPLVCEVIPCPNLNSVLMNLHYDMGMITDDLASAISELFNLTLQSMVLNPYDTVATRPALPTSCSEVLSTLFVKEEKKDESASLNRSSADWTELQKLIREAFSSISGVSEHAIHRPTTIFQLGLDSINAVQIASVLRAQNLPVSSSDVVQCASCEALAARIVQNESVPQSGDVLSFDFAHYHQQAIAHMPNTMPSTSDIEAILPCTSLQDAMISGFLNSAEGYYLNFLTFKVRQGVDLSGLEYAWIRLQQCHPMLRTGFLSTPQSESSFSMVRWKSSSCRCPVTRFQKQSSNDFDISTWRGESKLAMKENLGQLLWRVALVETDSIATMNVAIHHALYDAKTLGDLFRGLRRILKGDVVDFPPIEPALAQLLLRTRSKDLDTQNFWENEADKTVVNRFPIMNPLREEDWKVVTCQHNLSMSMVEIHSITKKMGISIQAVLQATWARILASYLGESSVVFGVVFAGRNTDETAEAPFPCLTTVPVIAETRSSNKGLLDTMMEYNSRSYKHQFVSLASIQKWLGHAGSPVFDTVLVYQNTQSCLPDAKWDLIADEPSVEYTVSLEVEPSADGEMCIRLTTRSDVVPTEQAELILRQFNAALVHLVSTPDGAEDELHKSNPELFSIIPALNSSLQAPVQLVHEFVEQKADSQPHLPALEFVESFTGDLGNTRTWTYEQLDKIGNQVAHLLAGTVSAGDIVAVHFPKCPEAYFSLLGILKAGCSFIALDPSAPSARKRFILEDSRATCLLIDGSFDTEFELDITVLKISEETLALYPISRIVHAEPLPPQSTCYCLYTSGTTGTPKGCEITHENTVQALMAFQDLFQGHWQQDSRWLQFAGFHFDVSVLEQYWSWSVGITVVAAPKDLILDDLVGSINKLEITHIDLTPSLARLTHPDDIPSLCKGVFITGGEQLHQEILDAWGPKGVIYNAYGPTEATIGVTMYQRVPVNGRPSNIGKQFPNVGSFVFHSGTEVPVMRGGVGELCVSGKLVGKGYLHRPELTREKFPILSDFSGERIYRTGDLVRILSDGSFDFLGRADDQVKLRGQRLETGEINHTICSTIPEIQAAATVVLNHNGKDVLVAFLAEVSDHLETSLRIADGGIDLASKARASCIGNLPGYMIPTYFIVLTYMPLSSNNKVDAKRLKSLFTELDPQVLMTHTGRSSLSLNQPVDGRILSRVIEVLGAFANVPKEQISETTSVFDLGVDSVSVLQLSAVLKEKGIIGATPASIIRNPIISDLVRTATDEKQKQNSKGGDARAIHQRLQAWKHKYQGVICRDLNIETDDIDYIAPCSSLQEGMISAALSEEISRPYFNWFDVRLSSDTSMTAVRQAWEKTIQCLPILRTVFVKTTDGYFQVAMSQAKYCWRKLFVTQDHNIKPLLHDDYSLWVAENASNIHILSPLQFVHVTGPELQQLRLFVFHGLYDGSSIQLMQDFAARIFQNETPVCGPSFVDALCRGPLQKFEFCRPFWEEHLRDWRPSPLLRTASSEGDIGQVVSLSRDISVGPLEDLRKEENVTLQAIILSIWTVVLQSYTAQPLTLGVVVSGRAIDLPHIENTVGPLFNTIPFFSKSLNDMTWQMLVQRCHAFNADTLAFQHVPLKDIQKWCSRGRSLLDSLFAFQQEESAPANMSSPWTFVEGRSSSVNYSLAFEATRSLNGTLHLHLVARDGMANRDALEQMLNHFAQIALTVKQDTIFAKSSTEATARNDSANFDAPSKEPISSAQPDWTPTASVLREELCALANIPFEDVQPGTSILELGIDSIDAIKISARLAKRGIRLAASQVTRLQTISAMENAATSLSTESSSLTQIDSMLSETRCRLYAYLQKQNNVDLDAIELVLPPTSLQESMIAGMIQSDFEWYYNHDVLELGEEVDMERLKDAWFKVIASSPILRTGFLEVDDSQIKTAYCQVVFKKTSSSIEIGQVSEIPRLQDVIANARERAVCGRGIKDLVQVSLISGPESKNYMVMSMAHALYDGWSLGLLFDDLRAAYQGQLQTREYSRILATQPALFMTGDTDAFWKTYLSHARPTVFTERPSMCAAEDGIVFRKDRIASHTMSTISSFCKQNSLSLQSLCTACWAAVVGFLSKSLDTVFGAVLSGRDFDDADQLMFPTMNTVAVRTVLHGTAMPFLQYVESCLADIRAHQRVPLREAQAAANLGGRQLFNSLLILQRSRDSASSEALCHSIDGFSAVEYPICVEAEATGDTLTWRIACKGQFFSENDTDDILQKIEQTLHFFLDASEEEVLSFDGGSVSICGLPSTTTLDTSIDAADSGVDIATQHSDMQAMFSWDDISTRIRAVLSEVSAVPAESIPPTATLYHLGLDSISAIKVSLLLRKVNIDLKPRELLQSNSIAEMASRIERFDGPEDLTLVDLHDWKLPLSAALFESLCGQIKISPEDVEAALPATAMQVYMLSAWQNSSGAVFFPQFCYEISQKYTQHQLAAAWNTLVESVPMLRTHLVSTGAPELPWAQIIVRAGSPSIEGSYHPMICLQIEESPFQQSRLLLLTIQHAFYDGFSLPAIMRLYVDLLGRTEGSDKPKLDIDLSHWRHFSILPTLAGQIESRKQFWVNYLHGHPSEAPVIPVTSPQTTDRVSCLRKQALHDIKDLQRRASSLGIGLQSLFFAALARSLHHRRAQKTQEARPRTIIFGVYLANQTAHSQHLHATYPTLNLVPLRVTLSHDSDLGAIAADIHRDLQQIQADTRADVGLWEIYNWTGIRVDVFVNFLSLFDGDNTDVISDTGEGNLRRRANQDRPVDHAKSMEVLRQPWLQNNAVKDAYPPSMDVEVSVHAQSLDIGVFGSTDCLSHDEAPQLVDCIVQQLGGT
ncbi:NRPS protein [Claviceps purpurea]|nr:NRPS protein [Claviceps purpurea]